LDSRRFIPALRVGPAAGILLAIPNGMKTSFIVDLVEVGAEDLSIAGGKAVNLGVMLRAGLPVPPGLCVTTSAYREIADAALLDEPFERLAATPATATADLAALAGRARAAVLDAAMPEAVKQCIVAAYESLGDNVPVAVRSSATAEDLPFASFAGQQDTYLNVIGADDVLQAVHRCWASLWTDRAVAYRTTNHIDHRTVRLAVVIQRMVDASIAGVLFTANPVTGRRRQAVIDASPGLGEAVVSGAVTPDRFVVETATGEILERRIGSKQMAIRSRTDGGTERIVRRSAQDEPCLTDDQLRAIAALGDRVEAYYGAPQDTEWAIADDGELWLTQARPITTLFPVPRGKRRGAHDSAGGGPRSSHRAADDDLDVYFCFSVAQGLNRPITPMGLAAFRLLASSISHIFGVQVATPLEGPTRYAEAGQRLFVDVTGVLRSRLGRQLFPRLLDVMEARSAVVMRRLTEDPRLAIIDRSPLFLLAKVLRVVARYDVPFAVLRALTRPAAAHSHARRVGEELEGQLTLPATATAIERLDFVQHILLDTCIPQLPRILPSALAGFAMLWLAGRLLGEDAEAGDLETVLRGLPHNVTTEMDLELWSLARAIRTDAEACAAFEDASSQELARQFRAGTLPEVAQRGLTDFLTRFGHRAVAEIDLGMPRWSEDPEHILGVLISYLQIEDGERAPDEVFRRRAGEASAMIDTLSNRARRGGRVRAGLIRFALGRARALAGLRELPKFNVVTVLAAARRELSIVGTALASRGSVERANDIFFVDLVEAREGLAGRDLRQLIADRRVAYELELRRKHVPRVILSNGTEPEAENQSSAAPDGALIGTPASSGCITGIARVVLDPATARLQPGEILVAPSTDPGWTPLFLVAGGLVMEMGGANSHGAVVAREYGIPAVVGVPDATMHIVNGQRISVDGGAGTVVAA
jgi:rifampicin phosphotransferase